MSLQTSGECPICGREFPCDCVVEGLSAKARAEANHEKRLEEFRKAAAQGAANGR